MTPSQHWALETAFNHQVIARSEMIYYAIVNVLDVSDLYVAARVTNDVGVNDHRGRLDLVYVVHPYIFLETMLDSNKIHRCDRQKAADDFFAVQCRRKFASVASKYRKILGKLGRWELTSAATLSISRASSLWTRDLPRSRVA